MVPPGEPPDKPEPPERPEYTGYKSRRGLLDRFRKPDLSKLTDKVKRGDRPPSEPKPPAEPSERPGWRRILKWVGLAALGWIVLSFLAFAISAQIQKGKLVDGAKEELDGGPLMRASPQ